MAKTLQNIRDKVRYLTGRKSPLDLTDSQIDFEINSFYQTEFPQALRILDLRQVYVFSTVPNQATYNLPVDEIQSVEPPCYVAGYSVYFTMDQMQFNALWPQLQVNETNTFGDATIGAGPYTFTTHQRPVQPSSYTVNAATSFNTSTDLVDDGNGNLLLPTDLGSASPVIRGTIDYETGIVEPTFAVAPSPGKPIISQYIKYLASRPNLIYYYSNQLTLYPVPDQVYEVKITIWKIPTALIDFASIPQYAYQGNLGQPTIPPASQDISEWWEALAYGASMKIYENNLDFDTAEKMKDLLDRKLNLIRRRTWYQMASQRSKTIYATPTVEAYPGWMYPGLFPGN